ncbi:AAA family ATPase [Ihuprevotella massiliensis]|uniref:AAA family ATPase n=1 Tax=Ihuprevotella massiliensis TaxID=1852368 RepID=UPI00094F34AD
MKLESLIIRNFRGFKECRVSFTPQTTIVIGQNGAGKTALIDAIKIALSFIFSNNNKLGDDILSAGNPSLNVNSFSNSDYYYDSGSRTTVTDASIKGVACYNGQQLEWELYKRSTANAALYSTRYKKAFEQFMFQWKEKSADLPLIACFSDSFPHKPTKLTKFALNTIDKERIPRNFGYYQWDLETACISIWETRLCKQLLGIAPLYQRLNKISSLMQSLEIKYTKEELLCNDDYQSAKDEEKSISIQYIPLYEEINFVQSKLVEFSKLLPNMKDRQYDIDSLVFATTNDSLELKIMFKNGKSSPFKDLPAGYRRLYSIVLDLAYRSYILNEKKEPSGVVLIDEIDLHLHPSLEEEVVQCFTKVFPYVQFIFTSHSAAVVANLETNKKMIAEGYSPDVFANQVLFLEENQEVAERLPIIYGLDYNSTLRDFMGTASRNREIKKGGDDYLVYCSLGMKTEAETTLRELTDKLGHEHEFIKELIEKARSYDVY